MLLFNQTKKLKTDTMEEKSTEAYNPMLDTFDHVVVLMLENRSFDNLLGFLYSPLDPDYKNGVPATAPLGKTFEGVYGKNLSNPIPVPPPGGPTSIPVTPLSDPNSHSPYPDPGETYDHVNTQLFNFVSGHDKPPYNLPPKPLPTSGMQGFVNDYIYNFSSFEYKGTNPTYDQYKQIMECYTPPTVPVLSRLAQEFGVFDHWFCSVPSQTWCNRAFWNAGTSWGRVVNGPSFTWTKDSYGNTIFNQISQSGFRSPLYWKVYTPDIMPVSLTTVIHQLALAPYHKWPFKNFWGMTRFYLDCALGTLPAYSFVEPMFIWPHNDMHPSSAPPSAFGKDPSGEVLMGDHLVWQVYDAIRRSPKADRTLLIITFDEHGGCYDHVAPPNVAPPDLKGYDLEDNFDFTRLGVRVPMIMISSHIAKNTIVNAPMDHCSFMNTIRKKWDKIAPGKFPALTARVAAAPDFSQVFTSAALRPASTWPVIGRPVVSEEFLATDFSNHPIGQLEKSIVQGVEDMPHAIEARKNGIPLQPAVTITTAGEALNYLNSIPELRPADDHPGRLAAVKESDPQSLSNPFINSKLSDMATSQNVPLTIMATLKPDANNSGTLYNSSINIGANSYQPNQQPQNVYWALVVDRTTPTLQVVANFTFTDNNNAPAQLNNYNNNSNYLLILTTRFLQTSHIPAGAFYDYLVSQFKAGAALQRIEQIWGAMQSSAYNYLSYTIVAPFDGSLEEALEFSETDEPFSIYTLQLVPELNPNGNGTLYVPYPLY
jgi:phospholipase C